MTSNATPKASFNGAQGAPSNAAVKEFFSAIARGDEAFVREAVDMFPVLLDWKEETRGATPVIMAARAGHTAVLHALAEKGADIFAEDRAGMDAFVNAASCGQENACMYLMQHDFNPEETNRSGISAAGAARAADFPALAERMERMAAVYRTNAKMIWENADVKVRTRRPVQVMKRLSLKKK